MLLAALLIAATVNAAPVKAPHLTVDLVTEAGSLAPGTETWIGVRFELEHGWHVYWQNAGDSGTPPVITWKLPPGFRAGEVLWPAPERLQEGPLVSFGYAGSVVLMAPLTVPANLAAGASVPLAATVKWLVCKDVCIPGVGEVAAMLPVGAGSEGDHAGLFKRTRGRLPGPVPAAWKFSAATATGGVVLTGTGTELRAPVLFFPLRSNEFDNAKPQLFDRGKDGARLTLALSDQAKSAPAAVEGVLTSGGRAWAIVVRVVASAAGGTAPAAATTRGRLAGFLWALILAFVGGMILNLMPCVFPILSIKVLGFVRESAHHPREVRIHGLLYGAGVVVAFWALAAVLFLLKSGGQRLGWGFQLQSPTVIFLLAATLFLLALNLFGVFEAGTSVARTAGSFRWGEGRSAAFFTGVLATFLATPCTAPFMGTAVGYAVVQPAHVGLGVFTLLALGMAAPYVALSYAPGLGRLLPRPGRWMETFKQIMAFPLLVTVIWLIWVLGLQAGLIAVISTLAGLLAIGVGGGCTGGGTRGSCGPSPGRWSPSPWPAASRDCGMRRRCRRASRRASGSAGRPPASTRRARWANRSWWISRPRGASRAR